MPSTRPDIEISEQDLALACLEVLHWRQTGQYRGYVLELLAEGPLAQFGSDAMRQAEYLVLLRAAEQIAKNAPHSHVERSQPDSP